jgi:hypothetical protein
MSSLAESLPEQQRRVREEILPKYESLRGMPQVNVEFAIMTIKALLANAERAAASGDVVAMIRAHEELKEIE